MSVNGLKLCFVVTLWSVSYKICIYGQVLRVIIFFFPNFLQRPATFNRGYVSYEIHLICDQVFSGNVFFCIQIPYKDLRHLIMDVSYAIHLICGQYLWAMGVFFPQPKSMHRHIGTASESALRGNEKSTDLQHSPAM